MKYKILFPIVLNIIFYSCVESSQTRTDKFNNFPSKNCDTVSQLNNNIRVIYQDSKNVYWFGSSESGVYRYDGNIMANFTTKHGLPSNRIEEIKEDKSGNIFINTNAGLCKYDGKSITTIHDTFLQDTTWKLLPEDLWFKSPKSGYVYRYDGKFLHNLKVPKSKQGEQYLTQHKNLFAPYIIYCNYKDSKGNIWFGTALMGVFRFNGKLFDWISEPDVTEMHSGPANGVRSIVEDKNGDFWFNTAYRYRIDNILIGKISNRNNTVFYERIKSIGCLDGKINGDLNEYLSILKDNNNNLWMATYLHGVWKYDGKTTTHYPIQVNSQNIPIVCLYKDNSGDIWLGTQENGVWKLNEQTFERVIH